ncbi:MAG: DUF4349 domain-containing protein [Fimbriimonadales bacterium]|nr:DUF4349 domain-containing protein [Fimbriimonadales bacterium]
MKEKRMREEIKAYLDNELSPEERVRVEKVLAEDPALHQEVEDYKRISSSLKAFQRGPEVPSYGVARALGGVEASWRIRGGRKIWAWGMASVFALVVVVGVAVLRFGGKSGGEQGTPLLESTPEGLQLSLQYPTERARVAEKRLAPGVESPAPAGDTTTVIPSAPYISQRYVIRRASVHIRVENVREAERKVRSLVSLWGGFVESSSEESEDGRRAGITMVIRVPEARFEGALSELDQLGVRVRRQTSGEDVTTAVVDYEARLRNLRSEEEAYRQIMRSARRVTDILEVQERLSRVRGEIESLEGQLQALKRLSALSTIELTLEERPRGSADGDPNWAVDAWRRATEALMAVLRGIAVGVIWAFVYSPLWLPVVFLGILAWRLSRR